MYDYTEVVALATKISFDGCHKNAMAGTTGEM
jgi:hypothetical protein